MSSKSQTENLGKRISIGASWMVGVRLSIKFLGLLSSIVLARLLVPEDFGLVALAMSVYALIRLISEFGFGLALIQNQSAARSHYDTAWTLQLILSVCAGGVLVALIPIATSFYDEPRMAGILWALSCMFLLGGLQNIGVIDFEKNMTFDKVFWLRVTPKLISTVTAVSLAFVFRNYWALLAGQLINNFSLLVLSYVMQSFRPRLSLRKWRELISFSSWLMINNLVKYLDRHGRNLLVAKVGGTPMVGLLTVAYDFATIVSLELISPINTAAYPAYSRMASQQEALKKTFIDVIGVVGALAFPGALALAFIAPLFVPVLLGNKWLEAIHIIPPLATASILISLMTAFDIVFMAMAKQRITALFVTIRVLIFFPIMYFGMVHSGAVGVAIAVFFANIIVFPLYLVALKRLLNIGGAELISVLYRPALSSGIMSFILFLYVDAVGPMTLGFAGLIALALSIALGFTVFLTCMFFLWKIVGSPEGIESRALTILQKKLGSFFNN